MELNAAQRQAAHASDGPIAIIAGPGTGKTKTLTERIRFLLSRGVPPARILALTFTKKAAEEMQARLANPAVHIATFHGLCFELITEREGAQPAIIAEPARLALIKSIKKPKNMTARELSLAISRSKNGAGADPHIAKTVATYNHELGRLCVCDFDDVLLRVRDSLQQDSAWHDAVKNRYDHILVDEFQDTNALQYELLQLLRSTQNICVIGDPQQSIYGFRGADGDIFGRFLHDFGMAHKVVLDINYRSTQAIVQLANAVYPAEPALTAWNRAPGHVRAVEVLNEYSEAAWILASIQKAIGGSDLQRAVSDDDRATHCTLGDFAILYRGRAAARAVQKACADSGIPCQVVGDGSPYEDPMVQIIIQLLAKIADPTRTVAIKDLSTGQIEQCTARIDATAKPYDAAEAVIAMFGLELTPALRQLLGTLLRFATATEATVYFDAIAGQNFYDPRADAVTLLTIHAAKGLEFSRVFVVGVEDGVLPSTKGDPAEERRLFYVALTRARDQLYLLHARSRGGETATVSPFISALPPAILPRVTDDALAADQRKLARRQAKRAQGSLF